MWGAIKADLMTFVTTVTEDTSKTINKVLGDDELEEEEDPSIQEKLIADLRRSYETYSTPIRENDQRDYDRFKKKFNLSSSAAEIASVLDQESEVSRFYAELVPISISPEEFWGRLFFRMSLVYRHGTGLDEEDDEELVWEEEEEVIPEKAVTSADNNAQHATTSTTTGTAQCSHSSQTATIHTSNEGTNTTIPVNDHMNQRVLTLEEENKRLQEQEESLKQRIAQLEALLATQSNVTQSSSPIVQTTSIPSEVTTTPPSKSKSHSETAQQSETATPSSPIDTGKSASSKKKKTTTGSTSTAKKLFDSPTSSTATKAATSTTTTDMVADHNTTTEPSLHSEKEKVTSTPLHTTTDHASQSSSEESAIVVNRSDLADIEEEDQSLPLPSSSGTKAATTVTRTTVSGVATAAVVASAEKGLTSPSSEQRQVSFRSSQETAKYLASLDDQDDDEEDGWN